MSEKVVLVTGGRDYTEHAVVAKALDAECPIERVIHGGGGGYGFDDDGGRVAYGADMLAHVWAKRWGVSVSVYPAEWERYGRKAGPYRNREMAETLENYRAAGCDVVVLAFPGGRGTANMVSEARKRKLPVKEVGS
jgi:hypothetical protein